MRRAQQIGQASQSTTGERSAHAPELPCSCTRNGRSTAAVRKCVTVMKKSAEVVSGEEYYVRRLESFCGPDSLRSHSSGLKPTSTGTPPASTTGRRSSMGFMAKARAHSLSDH